MPILTPEEEIAAAGQRAAKPSSPKPEYLADAIVRISNALEGLMARSRLNRDAIIALVHDDTKISKRTIMDVLDGLVDLQKKYVVPIQKKT